MPKCVDHDERKRAIADALGAGTRRGGGLDAVSFRESRGRSRRLGAVGAVLLRHEGRPAARGEPTGRGRRPALRIVRCLARLGSGAAPLSRLLRTLVRDSLPTDEERREAMILFFVFYTAEMTDPSLAPAAKPGVCRSGWRRSSR